MNVDYAHAVKKRDHHEFLGGLALSGLLGSGRSSMLPLGTLSLGLWVITIDITIVITIDGCFSKFKTELDRISFF